MMWSTDGKTWNASANSTFSVVGYGVAWNGSLWVAGGNGGGAASSLMWSTDGKTWNASANNTFSTNGNSVAWNGNLWVAAGFGIGAASNMMWSTDGTTWNASTNSTFSAAGVGVASAIPLTTYAIPPSQIGDVTLSNSIVTVGAATAGSTTSGSVNVSGGYFVNGVALSTGGGGGSTISGSTTSGNVLLATGTSTGIQGNTNLFFNTTSNFLGIQTTTPATALDVNGGLTIRNGYRPIYSNVSTGTSLTISANTYGTHYNITTSAITAITLPTVTGATDSNAYWVFRNNTGTYLSITFTYTTAGTTFPTNPVTIPPANSITMMVTFPSSVLGYVLF